MNIDSGSCSSCGSCGSSSLDSYNDNNIDEVFWSKKYCKGKKNSISKVSGFISSVRKKRKDIDRINKNICELNISLDEKKNLIDDLILGFCSSDDYLRLMNVSKRWKISKRNAAELIVNVDSAQSFIVNSWV